MGNPYAGFGSAGGSGSKDKKKMQPNTAKSGMTSSKNKPEKLNQKPGKAPTKTDKRDMNVNKAPKTKNEAAPFTATKVSTAPLTITDSVNNLHTKMTSKRLRDLGF